MEKLCYKSKKTYIYLNQFKLFTIFPYYCSKQNNNSIDLLKKNNLKTKNTSSHIYFPTHP